VAEELSTNGGSATDDFSRGEPLSHSIELPYTEGAESACLISPWDTSKYGVGLFSVHQVSEIT